MKLTRVVLLAATLMATFASGPVAAMIGPREAFLLMPKGAQCLLLGEALKMYGSLGPEAIHYQTWNVPLDREMARPALEGEPCGPADWAAAYIFDREPPGMVNLDHPIFDPLLKRKRKPGKLNETAKKLSDDERITAQVLLQEGWDITTWKEIENDGGRNAEGYASRRSPIIDGRMKSLEHHTIEFKRLLLGADSDNVVDRVMESLTGGGQAPYIVVDLRRAETPEAEALRSIARIRGALIANMKKGRDYEWRLFELRLVGNGYDHIADYGTAETLAARKSTFLDGIVGAAPIPEQRPRTKK